ncbi:hypothetical protein BE04_39470 [Sorangium cellulosum]|uniref:DNA-directed DNA polymerase n=1 Tax=Sorangium cellulosum TaxID=56 RepID=A0A150PQ14_SORCE|nr:hypothetical protein BE04_39470 [Sorangium cellulosum]
MREAKKNLQNARLRQRPEVGRLRARGGLTQEVLVDARSIADWCSSSGLPLNSVVAELCAAADDGRRTLVFFGPMGLAHLARPHQHVIGQHPLGDLLVAIAVPPTLFEYPSVVVAGIEAAPELLRPLASGAINVLDISTGRLWTDRDAEQDVDKVPRYRRERDAVFEAVREAGKYREQIFELMPLDNLFAAQDRPTRRVHAALVQHAGEIQQRAQRVPVPPYEVAQLTAALAHVSAQGNAPTIYVAASTRRENGDVVIDQIAVDDSQRIVASGHTWSMDVLADVVQQGRPVVWLGSMDLLGALYAAGQRLPARVHDPALAVHLLDPDNLRAPAGINSSMRLLLEPARPPMPRLDLHRVLDELPDVDAELRAELGKHGLLAPYDDDVSTTLPVLAGIEQEGFWVNRTGIGQDVATVEQTIDSLRAQITAGPNGWGFAQMDLRAAADDDIGAMLDDADGALPAAFRHREERLARHALYGNPRARAIKEFRTLHTLRDWLLLASRADRLRGIFTPNATGRWYAHGEALTSIPKHHGLAKQLLLPRLGARPGEALVGADFSAYEPRILAHLSGDPVLVAACQQGDPYQNLAPQFGLIDRDTTKMALLALIYGQQPDTFAASLPMTMASGQKVFRDVERVLGAAVRFRQDYQAQHPDEARALSGWRRLRPANVSRKKFARQAFSLLVQGTAADVMRKALRDLARVLPAHGGRLIHQAFDAVVIACPAGEEQRVGAVVKDTMESVAQLRVPLVVKIKSGPNMAAIA